MTDLEVIAQTIQRYENYLTVDPLNIMLRISLGDLYHKTGQLDFAETCYNKALALDCDNPVVHGRLANLAISQHRFLAAEEIIKSIDNYQSDRVLVNNLGIALCYQEKWQEAKELLGELFQQGIHVSDVTNLKYLIYALHHCGEEAQALTLAKSWYDIDDSTDAKGLIALLEMDLGDMHTAYDHATHVLQADPDNSNANMVAGFWCTEQQDMDIARDHFYKVVAADPASARGWQGLGLTFMYGQNFTEAKRCFLRFQELNPDHVTNYLLLGWNEMAQQNVKEAEKYFRQAVATDRTFSEAHGGLAAALAMQNKLEEAQAHIERAKGLDAKSFGAVYAQSISLHLKGKAELGTRIFAKMLERVPNNGEKPLIEHLQLFFRQQESQQKRFLQGDKKSRPQLR